MDSTPSPNNQNQSADSPQAEVLKPRTDEVAVTAVAQPPPGSPQAQETAKKPRHRTYRPSHRATFIGLAAVILIFVVNAAVLGVLLKRQNDSNAALNKEQVTISTDDLSRLGINRDAIGDAGVELIVGPDAQFKGKLAVAGAATISGDVVLNNKLTAANVSSTQLQAGNTTLGSLNVNADTSLSDLIVREDLVVSGAVNLQGQVSVNESLSVKNSLTVNGNLTIGGKLSVNTFSVHNIIVGGHIVSNGPTPFVGKGAAAGSNGTVSISGNDTAGTIAVNVGTGGGNGTMVNLAFRTQYSASPHVVITPVGRYGDFYLTNITVGGFSIAVQGGLSTGQYKFNYVVVQ